MRLFHASEEPEIAVFHPRRPARGDLDPDAWLVWAVNEECLPNYLTPRDCPRVTFHVGPETAAGDVEKFFPSPGCRHVVAIERKWLPVMRETVLYLYEFDASGFALQDEVAGYYVSTRTEVPVARTRIADLPGALAERGVELRVLDSLWALNDEVQASTLRWSMCRMRGAQARL